MLPISQRFQDAVAYALTLHREQERKGSGIPYVAHLFSVAALAIEHGADEDEAIAALLHDAVEDQGGVPILDEIRERFGETVAEIVHGCTDAFEQPKPPWRDRKEAYIVHLKEANDSVRLVSASDKLHNARSILNDYLAVGEEVFERFKGGKAGTIWYYRELVEVFKELGPKPLANELDQVVSELERLSGPPASPRSATTQMTLPGESPRILLRRLRARLQSVRKGKSPMDVADLQEDMILATLDDRAERRKKKKPPEPPQG